MARIRTIKPEFFTSLTVASLTVEARLTFIGLWTHVDDEGRCVDDARLIKAAVWPLDDRTAGDIEDDLKALTESSLITRYTVGERSYLAVNGWSEHQRINRPTPSRLPAPSEADGPSGSGGPHGVTSGNTPLSEDSVRTHAQLSEDSPPERNRERNREQGKEEPSSSVTESGNTTAAPGDWPPKAAETGSPRHLQAVPRAEPTPSTAPRRNWSDQKIDADPHFAAFWTAYPNKVGKGNARQAWLKALRKGADPAELTNAATSFRDDPRRKADFTAHPTTWLNGERWKDQPVEAPPPTANQRPFWEN